MLCYASKTLYLSSVFGSFVLEICVSPRSPGGGGGFPDAQDLHPQHHQDYLVAMNLWLSFADTSGVLLFQAMLLGVWVKPSAVTLEERLKSAKNESSCNSPHCETSPALSCF